MCVYTKRGRGKGQSKMLGERGREGVEREGEIKKTPQFIFIFMAL